MQQLLDAHPDPIAVVGNINLDIKSTLIAPSPAIFDDGETSVEEIYHSIGGGAANVAVAAARLGADVHFCGAVGADSLGDRLAEVLRGFEVQPKLATKSGAATGQSINLNWSNHHRHFVSSLPSAALLALDDVDFRALQAAGCRHFYRGDIWFADSLLGEGNAQMFSTARNFGMTTYVDINWDPAWSDKAASARKADRIARATQMLPLVDFAHGNERELAIFTGCQSGRSAAAWMIDRGVGAVIVHLGHRGSAALTSAGEWVEAPAVPVERAVCETGTGDVFSAAFMLLSSQPLAERLNGSNIIASDHISGRREFLPRIAG